MNSFAFFLGLLRVPKKSLATMDERFFKSKSSWVGGEEFRGWMALNVIESLGLDSRSVFADLCSPDCSLAFAIRYAIGNDYSYCVSPHFSLEYARSQSAAFQNLGCVKKESLDLFVREQKGCSLFFLNNAHSLVSSPFKFLSDLGKTSGGFKLLFSLRTNMGSYPLCLDSSFNLVLDFKRGLDFVNQAAKLGFRISENTSVFKTSVPRDEYFSLYENRLLPGSFCLEDHQIVSGLDFLDKKIIEDSVRILDSHCFYTISSD